MQAEACTLNPDLNDAKAVTLNALAKIGRGFYVPSFYDVIYNDDGTAFDYIPNREGVPRRVGRALASVNPKEGTLRRALKRGETELVDFLVNQDTFCPSTAVWSPGAEMGDRLFSIVNLARKLHVEPEAALRVANDKFQGRFEGMEQAIARKGRALRDLSLSELEALWAREKLGHEGHEDTKTQLK